MGLPMRVLAVRTKTVTGTGSRARAAQSPQLSLGLFPSEATDYGISQWGARDPRPAGTSCSAALAHTSSEGNGKHGS